MKMNFLSQIIILLLVWMVCFSIIHTAGFPSKMELRLEPPEAFVEAGSNVTFVCSSSVNQTFHWVFDNHLVLYRITKGIALGNGTNSRSFWSKLTVMSAKRMMSGEVTCISGNGNHIAVSSLMVNGVHIGGQCTSSEDCITDGATCQKGLCECPRNGVLMRLTKSGHEVCRKMIYRLYDPCEFSEQCFHLVDGRSVCSSSGVCVCAAWAIDHGGKCVSKGELTYNKNHQLYMVGLVIATCLIIAVVAVSLWITMKKSCNHDGSSRQNTRIVRANRVNEVIMELADDKPPSYDDALEVGDNVGSPPNFKDALKYSMTAKKLLRQVSAPAGQLLSRTTSYNSSRKMNTNVVKKGS